jgi:hypothetical protein
MTETFLVLKKQNLVTNLQNLFFIYKYFLTLFLIKKKWKLFEFCKTLKNCNHLKSLFSAILREKGETEHFHHVEWNFSTFCGIFRHSCGLFLALERNIPTVAYKFFPTLSIK